MYVYVIGHSEAGPVKVGRSIDPESRRSQLQTGNPERLHVLRQVDCGAYAAAVEVAAQVVLQDVATDPARPTEWFRVTAEVAERVVLEELEAAEANPPDMLEAIDLRSAPAPGCDRSPSEAVPFYDWLLWRPSYRDLADDLLTDPRRPKGGRSYRVLRDHLLAAGAPLEAIQMLRFAWSEHVSSRLLSKTEMERIHSGRLGLWVEHQPGFVLLVRQDVAGAAAGVLLARAHWESASELQVARNVRDQAFAAWLPRSLL